MNTSDRVTELLHERAKVAILLAALEGMVRAWTGQHTNGPQDAKAKQAAHDAALTAIRQAKGASA